MDAATELNVEYLLGRKSASIFFLWKYGFFLTRYVVCLWRDLNRRPHWFLSLKSLDKPPSLYNNSRQDVLWHDVHAIPSWEDESCGNFRSNKTIGGLAKISRCLWLIINGQGESTSKGHYYYSVWSTGKKCSSWPNEVTQAMQIESLDGLEFMSEFESQIIWNVVFTKIFSGLCEGL